MSTDTATITITPWTREAVEAMSSDDLATETVANLPPEFLYAHRPDDSEDEPPKRQAEDLKAWIDGKASPSRALEHAQLFSALVTEILESAIWSLFDWSPFIDSELEYQRARMKADQESEAPTRTREFFAAEIARLEKRKAAPFEFIPQEGSGPIMSGRTLGEVWCRLYFGLLHVEKYGAWYVQDPARLGCTTVILPEEWLDLGEHGRWVFSRRNGVREGWEHLFERDQVTDGFYVDGDYRSEVSVEAASGIFDLVVSPLKVAGVEFHPSHSDLIVSVKTPREDLLLTVAGHPSHRWRCGIPGKIFEALGRETVWFVAWLEVGRISGFLATRDGKPVAFVAPSIFEDLGPA